jgi:hypothetical protein
MLFAALHWSACGTKQRKPRRQFMSAFGGVAEVHGRTASVAFDANDPTATLAVHRSNGFDADLSPIKVLV